MRSGSGPVLGQGVRVFGFVVFPFSIFRAVSAVPLFGPVPLVVLYICAACVILSNSPFGFLEPPSPVQLILQ